MEGFKGKGGNRPWGEGRLFCCRALMRRLLGRQSWGACSLLQSRAGGVGGGVQAGWCRGCTEPRRLVSSNLCLRW